MPGMLPLPAAPRRRPHTGRWWLLVAGMGAATIWSAGATVHDTDQRREAAMLVARTTADHIATLVAGRLEVLGAGAFAPAAPWSSLPAPSPEAAVAAMVAHQVDGQRCQCRPWAPATHFFQVSPGAELATVAPVPGASADSVSAGAVRRRVLDELAVGSTGRLSSVRLLADRELPGRVILLAVRREPGGEVTAAYGLVAPSRAMAMAIFPHDPPPAGMPRSSVRVIMLDTLSLAMTAADSTRVFGGIGPDRPFQATIQPEGALAGMALTVALAADQVPHRVLVDPDQLWILGLLGGITIVLIVVAAGAARRETLLARARSDFIAGVSHDLRMPLAQVLLAGETLALGRAEGDAQRRTLAESIVREARRLTGLVDNVLLFSRSGAVALGPARQPVEVDGLLADVAEAVRLSVADAGQALVVGPAAGLVVRGDSSLLRQALVNLVDNALKYGARGQEIRIEGSARGAEGVEIRVEDQGPGIPPAARARVFEPYTRLPGDQASERTGSGLGLAVVRQIMGACGGSVRLEEAPGGGTRAVLSLQSATGPGG